MKGELILAANSIGADSDIPTRTLEMLKESDLLVFEEDRPARRLLKAAGVHRDYIKHNEHKSVEVAQEVRAALTHGKTVLYASDQGCAGVADPGNDLVKIAYEVGARIKVIPGPSSITAAISACPFDCSSFDFVGFLPREETERVKKLLELRAVTQIIIDAPYRLLSLLKSCDAAFGKKRQIFLALDISGPSETYYYGNANQMLKEIENLEKQLNFVLIVSASS